MSENVHGHQQPTKGITVNPDNPVFGRHQPVYEAPEVAAGLHGAPALRSESERPVEAEKPAQDPIPDHEDEAENPVEQPELDTGATDPEFSEDREETAKEDE